MSRQERRAQQRQLAKQTARETPTPNAATPTAGTGGPATPQGKAVSSQNATSHGLTAARLVLPWENQAEFDTLLADLLQEHRPATVTERILVREIAEQYWRLQRARNHEYQLLAGASRSCDSELERAVGLAQRYATRHERAFHQCLRTLRTLQKERRQAEAEAADEAAEAAEAAAPPSTAQPIEFVSQNAQLPVFEALTADCGANVRAIAAAQSAAASLICG